MKISLLAVFFLASIIGCSSDSDSNVSDATIVSEESVVETVPSDEMDMIGESGSIATTDLIDETTTSNEGTSIDEADNTRPDTDSDVTVPVPTGQDPLIQNDTEVNFEITVPAYQSDELQVRINWNETELTAAWIGDELWSVSAKLPNNIGSLLVVTFSDDNGGLILATYEIGFRPSINGVESFVVNANDFNSESWDSDMDGISNLSEVIAGTNPLEASQEVLEVRDSIEMRYSYRVPQLELLLPEARPYTETSVLSDPTECEFINDCTTITRDIELNESGAGSIFHIRDFDGAGSRNNDVTESTATRLVDSDSVTWSGTWSHTFETDFLETEAFSVVTTRLDNQLIRQTGEVQYMQFRGVPRVTTVVLDNTFDLTSRTVEGSSGRCEPLSGTIELETGAGSNTGFLVFWPTNVVSRSATKQLEDNYWTITDVFTPEQPAQRYWVTSIGDHPCELADL